MNDIDSKAPHQCTVRQAAYVVRHGSRYVEYHTILWSANILTSKLVDFQILAHMSLGLHFTIRCLILGYIPWFSFKFSPMISLVQIQAAAQQDGFEARGSLRFIPKWKPVLTNPALQLAQESMTGWKEV